MDVRVLRYFIAIAHEQNISHAASLLHVSQPALSRQIADLENQLGTKLFNRSHRQIQLTQDGYYLLERAEEIIRLVDKTTYNLQKQDTLSGTIDLGAGESSAIKNIMDSIQEITHKYPEVHVNLYSEDSEDILARVDNGILEFGIIMGHRELTNYNQLSLPVKNRWGILMRADEQLSQQKTIKPSDLLGRPLMISRQTRLHSIIQKWSNGLFDQFNIMGTYNLIYNAALLARTGACIVLTYENLVETTAENGLVFRPLTPEQTEPNILIWSKNRELPDVDQLFLDTIKNNVKLKKKCYSAFLF